MPTASSTVPSVAPTRLSARLSFLDRFLPLWILLAMVSVADDIEAFQARLIARERVATRAGVIGAASGAHTALSRMSPPRHTRFDVQAG